MQDQEVINFFVKSKFKFYDCCLPSSNQSTKFVIQAGCRGQKQKATSKTFENNSPAIQVQQPIPTPVSMPSPGQPSGSMGTSHVRPLNANVRTFFYFFNFYFIQKDE